jgi:hypothetical protein
MWNSLEIVKIIISATTPIIIAVIAYGFNKRLKTIERRQSVNHKILEKRLEIYDYIVPKLNDLLCFYCYIGNWKELSPKNVIDLKRDLDKKMHVYKPLFNEALWKKYHKFMHICFKTFSGWGNDAKICSTFIRRKESQINWNDGMELLFSEEFIENADSEDKYEERQNEIKKNVYFDLLEEFKNSLEIFQYDSIKKIKTPQNINPY